MRKRLQTQRLTLRPLRLEDARDLHAFFADAEANRFFGTPHRTMAQTAAWVAQAVAADTHQNREYALVQKGYVIGRAAIWQASEIGFFLRRDAWGQGLMTEALTALLPHFFDTLRLSKITADVDPCNGASLALLRTLGFTQTHSARHTIKIGDEWCDSVYLSCPAKIWT